MTASREPPTPPANHADPEPSFVGSGDALQGASVPDRADTRPLENLVMPGQTARAPKLAQLNVTSVQFATPITVR